MKRREFLSRAVPVTALPFVLNGFPLFAYGRSPLMDALTSAAFQTDRVLVLIQLNGGNDGLNMVIPVDRYAELTAARSNILIPQASVLGLTPTTGLHPSMTGLKSLYDAGELLVIQSVGYPKPNFSHFRSTDIWLTATDAAVMEDSGWLGRYLDGEYPGFPTGYPNAGAPDPLALQIGSMVSGALQGPSVSMGVAVTNPTATYTYPGAEDTPPDSPAGHELTFVRRVAQQTQKYSTGIKAAYNAAATISTLYPTAGTNSVADQLKIVARLIAGGLKSRVYIVSLGGFDTHSNQTAADTTTGAHATLLGKLSVAITAFQDDLAKHSLDDRVLGMTFSEFGRRIKSNSSTGTDHGTAAPLFLFGKQVNPGVMGTSPVLPAVPTVNDNVPLQFDFRSIYQSILKDWFGASAAEIAAAVTGTIVNPIGSPVVAASAVASSDSPAALPERFALDQNFPNPFNPTTTIQYSLKNSEHIVLKVYDLLGHEVAVLADGPQSAGVHQVTWNAERAPSGTYLCRLQAGGTTLSRKMLLLR
jgi:uncharacterized protein (DUF1501 family)